MMGARDEDPTITGTVTGHWEQGWEGRILWALEPDTPSDWPIPLADFFGDELTLFAADGSVLWSGILRPIYSYGFLGLRRVHPGDGHWFPQGTSLQQWRTWLTQLPQLRAAIRRVAPATHPG